MLLSGSRKCVASIDWIHAFWPETKLLATAGDTLTNIDLYQVDEWSGFQIRATEESSYPPGHECEIDTLLINRVDASVSMLSVPGPAAATKGCAAVWYPKKPKTVMYTLELGTPGVPQSQK